MAAPMQDKGQVSPSELVAFGIRICSRHGLVFELIDMLRFAQRAAAANVASQVQRLFYDSNSNVCTIELAGGASQTDAAAQSVHDIALETLSQFEWQGLIEHRQDGH